MLLYIAQEPELSHTHPPRTLFSRSFPVCFLMLITNPVVPKKISLAKVAKNAENRGQNSQNAVLRIIYQMFVNFDWKSYKNVISMISDHSGPLIGPNGAVFNF